jgi:hypothetical protein
MGRVMSEWQPIATAPEEGPLLIGCKNWLPVIAERAVDGGWAEYLGGECYGTKPPFEPTHWMALPSVD